MSGSVPDFRIKSLPLPSKLSSAAFIAFTTLGLERGSEPVLYEAFFNSCGTGSNIRARSLEFLSDRIISAKNCKPAMRPSPVVEKSL